MTRQEIRNKLFDKLVIVGNNLLKDMSWEETKQHPDFLAVRKEIAKAKEEEIKEVI